MKKILVGVLIFSSVFVLLLLWIVFFPPPYKILKQEYFPNAINMTEGRYGEYPIVSSKDLDEKLQVHGIAMDDFNHAFGPVNFQEQFILLTYNSQLIGVGEGWGLGCMRFAVVRKSQTKGIGIAVVDSSYRGPIKFADEA